MSFLIRITVRNTVTSLCVHYLRIIFTILLIFNISGNLEEFIEACDNAEKYGTDDTEILMLVGRILAGKNYDFKRVESILKRVIKLDPEHFEANLYLSLEYKKRQNIQASLKYYKRALQLNSNVAKDDSYSELMQLLKEERKNKSNRETSK